MRLLLVQFHSDVIADTELQAKPQVLVLGAYSTGKTSVRTGRARPKSRTHRMPSRPIVALLERRLVSP